MILIRSPLGAVGAILTALEAIVGGSLFAVKDEYLLQLILVSAMGFILVAVSLTVIWLVVYFALKNPGLLFAPGDIDPRVHRSLYGGGGTALVLENIEGFTSTGTGVSTPPEIEL